MSVHVFLCVCMYALVGQAYLGLFGLVQNRKHSPDCNEDKVYDDVRMNTISHMWMTYKAIISCSLLISVACKLC